MASRASPLLARTFQTFLSGTIMEASLYIGLNPTGSDLFILLYAQSPRMGGKLFAIGAPLSARANASIAE